MKFLRNLLDKTEATFFAPGKPFAFFFPFFEAMSTFFYTPGHRTTGKCHVRDCNDFKRMMITVMYALIPCIVMGMYNTGLQANVLMSEGGVAEPGGWHGIVLVWLNQFFVWCNAWLPAWLQIHLFDPSRWNILGCLIHGAVYFIPLYAITMIVGLGWEILFASVKRHDVNEGFFVTGLIFPLTLPPAIPLWQVAVAISFGVIFGKELFGGTGRNFLNPALVARAFLFFAYAGQISGDRVWTAAGVDGIAKATPLSYATNPDMLTGGLRGLHDAGYNLADSFFGFIPGSFGETSTLACLLGAVFLVFVGVASWRIMLSMTVGGMTLATLFWYFGGQTNAAMAIGPVWHFVLGGFAFGMVFMATDPVSASMTRVGQYIYGAMIGALIIVIRVLNPAYPEGTMLVILFGNCCAPLIDYFVVQKNIDRRLARIRVEK